MQIDLIYFSKDNTPITWQYGDVHFMPLFTDVVVDKVNQLVQQSTVNWLFFWDSTLGIPDPFLINELANGKIDVWHAGLKLGVQGLPEAIDFTNPAWIYNKDVDDSIISSSFRLSIRACLIRTCVLKKIGGLPSVYWTIDMMSLALGYSIMKQGGIMRYHPDLVAKKESQHALPLRDEWAFTCQFFPKKWQLWMLFNRKNFRLNYRYWRQTRHIKTNNLKPSLHPSQAMNEPVGFEKVSVLAPTLDRYPYLNNELTQLAAQTILPYEVLITDQTDEVNRQTIDTLLYPNLHIKYFPQSEKGQCVAWNKLLEEAEGDYVLFLGDDADNIKPDFIQKLLDTAQVYNADMVASNVIELKAPKLNINHHYYMADTFPITLIKKKLVFDAGMMDMFFNKNIRADYDLSLRCHDLGALMIFDSSALIDHHRAPSGGLRTYKARAITNSISKNSITKFAEPTASELFLVKKHFDALQFKMFVRIKYFDQLMIKGNFFKKLARGVVFLLKLPEIKKRYRQHLAMADAELKTRGIFKY